MSQHILKLELVCELRKVLNSVKYQGLDNFRIAEVLLVLENEGDYDPLGSLTLCLNSSKISGIICDSYITST